MTVEPLLFLCHRIPFPPNKGDKIRSYQLLRHLARRYAVQLATFVDDRADRGHLRALEGLCDDVRAIELAPAVARVRSLTARAPTAFARRLGAPSAGRDRAR